MDTQQNKVQSQLIVALDVASKERALELVSQLRGVAGLFKVGSQLFTAAGPSLVREIVSSGERVFLDLKFHDIPNTVAAAGVEATRLGVSIFTVHASGGSEMMRRTAEAVKTTALAEGIARPLVTAVTILTSLDKNTLVEIGSSLKPGELVQRLTGLAAASGMDGVVASPLEISIVREAVKKPEFVVIAPGIRPAGDAIHDQVRISTPRAAVLQGADYLVVGRPIIEAPNPLKAAQEILNEMQTSSSNGAS